MDDKKLKVGLVAYLTAALGYSTLKNFIFGNPPHKIRKALFYTSIASVIMYNSCSDDISMAYTKVHEIFNNPIREENIFLEKKRAEIQKENFMLYNEVNRLRIKVGDLEDVVDGKKKYALVKHK